MKAIINNYRRSIMRILTKDIGSAVKRGEIDVNQVKKILVVRPNNRLGNQLLITPLIKEINTIFPNSTIDFFMRGGLAPILFKNFDNIGRFYSLPGRPFKHLIDYIGKWISLLTTQYDLIINTNANSSSGRLASKFVRSKYTIFDLNDIEKSEQLDDYSHFAKHIVYNLRYATNQNLKKSISPLTINLSSEEIQKGKVLLDSMVDPDKPTIAIYTFATGSKMFTKEWWHKFYTCLKQKYGEHYNILEVLPKENVSQIDFQAINYYSTSIREMASVMHNTKLWIGADCGVMHLAVASGVPTIGLFSVTDIPTYKPYGGASSAIDMKTADIDDIMKRVESTLSNELINFQSFQDNIHTPTDVHVQLESQECRLS